MCCFSNLCVQGIKNVPNRLRIVVQRKRNEDDEDSVSAVRGLGCSSQLRLGSVHLLSSMCEALLRLLAAAGHRQPAVGAGRQRASCRLRRAHVLSNRLPLHFCSLACPASPFLSLSRRRCSPW